ncbi:hypothetical protein jhhlp_006520 [Lomentospora prolificans]|uniref:MMS19 nucleotide excision repair protein n=1 Tax=Lomentospora prolificans TaxID=41688 RepID=A0A2N3N650_9PEZI|nr:hypothetical protein jhhlp_006520 [Lomentospora prolificans]
MGDFHQLALQFVLTDDADDARDQIADKAANLIRSSPANTHPVARWVESIRPWMPGNEDAEVGDGGEGSKGDIIARAKALEFLATTLERLDKDTLIASHIKLLVAFFGAMFSVDHKAGILASAKALTTITSMKVFPASTGHDIIKKVCAMGNDFTKQVAVTRLAIFDLFERLVSDPRVTRDLKQRHSDYDFMIDMLDLFGNERDPKNLITWFSILETFLSNYEPSPELTEKIFTAYSAYFPISLRTSRHPSGITADDLKLALRSCFAADDRVASHAVPYLIQKLNQGDGVTVDVKLDILRTLKECVVRYKDPTNSVEPYVTKIWNCLKYEVRNGEVTETINTTLEVIRAMTGKLTGEPLRNFILTVLRECTDDLSNPTFAEKAGKLLVCTASATPGAFVLIVAPTVKHTVEDLRHAKARDHKRDLLALLNSILEVRSLFVGEKVELAVEDKDSMQSTESVLHSLYGDAYKPNLHADPVVSRKAVEGMGLLASQTSVASPDALLLEEEACSSISSTLIDLLTDRVSDVVDDTVVALQKVVMAWPDAFDALLSRVIEVIKTLDATDDSVDYLVRLTSRLSFIACSELPKKPEATFNYFTKLSTQLVDHLNDCIAASEGLTKMWTVYPAALQSAMRYFRDALDSKLDVDITTLEFQQSTTADSWVEQNFNEGDTTPEELYNRFFLISLQLTHQLYRQSTQLDASGPFPRLLLSGDTTKKGGEWRDRYLHLVSSVATLTIGQMSQAQQFRLRLYEDVVTLFRGRDQIPGTDSQYRSVALKPVQDPSVYAEGDTENLPPENARGQRFPIALSLGILQPLYPKVVESLFESGFGQEFAVSKLLASSSARHDRQLGSFLMILANKYKVENIPKVLALLEHQLGAITSGGSLLGSGAISVSARAALTKDIYAVIAGILRRNTGSSLQGVFAHLLKGPANEDLGHILAREFDTLFRPHKYLAKEFHATIRPLWSQKAYYQLIKPLLPLSWPRKTDQANSELSYANYSIATLAAVRHIDYSVYQDDAPDLVRLILCALRSLPISADVETALRALETITKESTSNVLEPFVNSVMDCCTAVITGSGPQAADLSWMPEGYSPADKTGKVSARCRNLAILLLGYLPGRYENRHLLRSVPRMERLLSVACGDRVREVRKSALAARLAWAKVS